MNRPVVRFTLSSLIVLVAVLGLGMAAMRSGSDLAKRLVFNVMLASLFIGLLGALVSRGGAWVGFSLFGWGFAALTFVPPIRDTFGARLFTTNLAEQAIDRIYGLPPDSDPDTLERALHANPGMSTPEFKRLLDRLDSQRMSRDKLFQPIRYKYSNSIEVFRIISVLVFALVGAVLGRLLSPRRAPAGDAAI
jgi:hypothetical protein